MKNCQLERIYTQLQRLNYKRMRSANGHWKIYTQEGRFIATGPSKDGDPHTVLNFRGDLRRNDPRLKGIV